MEANHQQNPRAILLSLCNLNPFGLGYFLSGQTKRWLFSLIGNLSLFVLGHQINASKNPAVWAGIFLVVFFGMSVDLWFLIKKKPELISEKLTKKAALLPLAAFLVNLIFYGGFFAFRMAGTNLIALGDRSYEAGDYENSLKNYSSASKLFKLSLNPAVVTINSRLNEVSTILEGQTFLAEADYPAAIETVAKFNENYPESVKKTEMVALSIDTYLAWARDLHAKNEFENSLDQLDHALKEATKFYPKRIQEINNAIAENYLQWGISLVEEDKFDLGIEKLEVVVDSYSQTDSFDLAYKEAAKGHYQVAVSLIDSNREFETAAAHINTVINTYPRSDVVDLALAKKPLALLGWGKVLNASDSFLKALEKYDEIKTITSDSDILAEVEAEIQKTIQLLARDVGGDGEVEILYTLQETCAGFPATRPTIDIFPEEPGKALTCDGNDYLIPLEFIADAPGTFRYIIEREDGSKRVQACPYEDGYTLERWVNTSLITVKNVKNGDVVTEKTFAGAPPEACPNRYAFSAYIETMWGDWVLDTDIAAWLEKVLN